MGGYWWGEGGRMGGWGRAARGRLMGTGSGSIVGGTRSIHEELVWAVPILHLQAGE